MNNTIRSYLDHCLLDEYAFKSRHDGYSMDVSDLPENEIANFLDVLLKHDPVMRELVHDRMQDVIDERLPIYESHDRYARGYVPQQDMQTGVFNWIPQRGYSNE